MKNHFIPVPDSPAIFFTEKYIYQVANGEFIVIGKHRVIFGYRLLAGYVDLPNNEAEYNALNICCGPEKEDYDIMFSKIKEIILSNPPDDPFKGIPQQSKTQPYFNDPEFCLTLSVPCKRRVVV